MAYISTDLGPVPRRAGAARMPQRPTHCDPHKRPAMTTDPWKRPSINELRAVLESIGKSDVEHDRVAERLELSVPAEVVTHRGNIVSAMTREISRFGIGLLHRGNISPGDVNVRMASETRQFEYRVRIEWCHPTDNGMFMSGGRFLNSEKVSQ